LEKSEYKKSVSEEIEVTEDVIFDEDESDEGKVEEVPR